jgi:hypothetical protein
MKFKSDLPSLRHFSSDISIVLFSFVSGFAVFIAVILLHKTGLRFVGSVLAGILTFVFALRGQFAIRERGVEMLRRFETIGQMNDRIRNALQVIECATYATNPQATEPVRNAVDVIEGVLHEVLVETHPALSDCSRQERGGSEVHAETKFRVTPGSDGTKDYRLSSRRIRHGFEYHEISSFRPVK